MAENGITITVTGKPVPKGRGRAVALPGGRTRVVTPQKTRRWEADARDIARFQMIGRELFTGCLQVTISCALPIPPSWPPWKREAAKNRQIGPAGKPDGTNLAKGAEDALNGIVWNDDSQITSLLILKFYSEKPYVEIRVGSLEIPPASTVKKADLE